jgi:peptidoglycan/LPS O-acetylase OafA/YrhL
MDGHVAAGRRSENSYDFIRFCAASAVLFSHHFDLAGRAEPLVPGYGKDFGELGVEIFFCLSGFLICLSLQRSGSLALFVSARVLRIFPNLAFVLASVSVVTLFWYGNFFNLMAHLDYVAANLLMFVNGVTHTIPGVFTDAARPAVNEPLWTLPYELWLYCLLYVLFVAGRHSRASVVVGALAIGSAWSAMAWTGEINIGPLQGSELFRLGSFFLSGAAIGVFWHRLERHALALGAGGLIAVFLTRNLLPFDSILHSLALAACVAGLGSSQAMAWFARGGDASYGIYVFAWPVQQFSMLLIGSFWLSMLAAFAVTVAIGYATWHGFEKRALSRRAQFAAYLRRLAAPLKTSGKPAR